MPPFNKHIQIKGISCGTDDVSFTDTGGSGKKNSVLFPIGIEPMT